MALLISPAKTSHPTDTIFRLRMLHNLSPQSATSTDDAISQIPRRHYSFFLSLKFLIFKIFYYYYFYLWFICVGNALWTFASTASYYWGTTHMITIHQYYYLCRMLTPSLVARKSLGNGLSFNALTHIFAAQCITQHISVHTQLLSLVLLLTTLLQNLVSWCCCYSYLLWHNSENPREKKFTK